jgi:hypothetical protein
MRAHFGGGNRTMQRIVIFIVIAAMVLAVALPVLAQGAGG